MDGELRLQLSEEGADAERLAVLVGYLRAKLLRLDVEDVRAFPAGEPPPGARLVGVASVGGLLIAFRQSAEALRSVVAAIRDWLRRGVGKGRTVRLELGDALGLSQASLTDQERLIELRVRRHSMGETASTSGQRLALIVANDEYEQAALRNLLAPRADAEALGRVLGDPQIGDFAVQVVRNEPSYVIQAKIEELFSESRSDDLLLLHFSCFGLKSESGELFFAAANTRPNRLGSTAVSADFVQRCMRASRSRSVVLLLDCCYGGAFAEESMVRGPSQGATMRAPSQGATTRAPSQSATMRASANVNMLDDFPQGRLGGGRGRAVITASNAMEYAFEGDRLADDQPRRPSVFTSALVEGLATGDADRDEDGWISLNELYDYVFDKVQEQNPHQTPSRHFELEGELYLARSPRRRIRPAPIPPDLQAAISDPNMYTRRGAVSELQARLTSEELPVATGAYGALAELAHTDIQYVAEAAAAALRQAAIRPEKTELHFGKRRQGSAPPHRSVRLLGPPIARACTARPSDNWIRVNATPDGFDVTVDTARTGPLRGNLDLKGLAGEAVIAIDVELLPQAAQTFPTERPTAPETREQQQFARQKARTGQETAEQIEREPDTAAASAAEARAEGKLEPGQLSFAGRRSFFATDGKTRKGLRAAYTRAWPTSTVMSKYSVI